MSKRVLLGIDCDSSASSCAGFCCWTNPRLFTGQPASLGCEDSTATQLWISSSRQGSPISGKNQYWTSDGGSGDGGSNDGGSNDGGSDDGGSGLGGSNNCQPTWNIIFAKPKFKTFSHIYQDWARIDQNQFRD